MALIFISFHFLGLLTEFIIKTKRPDDENRFLFWSFIAVQQYDTENINQFRSNCFTRNRGGLYRIAFCSSKNEAVVDYALHEMFNAKRDANLSAACPLEGRRLFRHT